MSKNKEQLLNGRVVTMSYYHEGEGVTLSCSVCADKFKDFLQENINDDVEVLLEDLEDPKFELKFHTITVEENKESEIQGLMWGDGLSREEAIEQIENK